MKSEKRKMSTQETRQFRLERKGQKKKREESKQNVYMKRN